MTTDCTRVLIVRFVDMSSAAGLPDLCAQTPTVTWATSIGTSAVTTAMPEPSCAVVLEIEAYALDVVPLQGAPARPEAPASKAYVISVRSSPSGNVRQTALN